MTLLYTPTLEVTLDEAFAPFIRNSSNNAHYGLTSRARDGKKSLRVGATSGAAMFFPFKGLLASAPMRLSIDVLPESLGQSSNSRFLSLFNALNSDATATTDNSMALRLGLTADNKLYVVHNGNNALVITEKIFNIGTLYSVEVEIFHTHLNTGFVRVWVDGQLVFEAINTPTSTLASRNGVSGIRLESTVFSTTAGIHYSNMLVAQAEGAQIGVPFGPLDFAYVPVQDASMGGSTTSDDTFTTFSDSVFKDFPLAADSRAGAAVAWSPRLRASTDGANPGLLDLRANGEDLLSRSAVSAGFQTYRPAGKTGPVPGALSIRNSPAT